ncbi:hypothetical protein S144_43 [Shewanella sp. phage 1/44]|uniref:hypothetical protein n=1 Tax=Shewanella sp. phage 1/44 TaxID=1458862 RepID=UPI0004F7CAC1|nr:hypothetical protein S144_43 [Shewanella sp. phage 1/44]AHK11757.1 hypothetical protein S144_43 [Shewanella sp. phage 1/44]
MLKQLQQELLPARMIMTVSASNADGTVTVTTGGGLTVRALGSGSVGDKLYVQGGVVIGTAPDLTHYDIEV